MKTILYIAGILYGLYVIGRLILYVLYKLWERHEFEIMRGWR